MIAPYQAVSQIQPVTNTLDGTSWTTLDFLETG